MPFLSMTLILDSFYLLISKSEKIANKSDVHFAVNDDHAYLPITHFDAQTTLCRLMFINSNNYKNNNDNNNKKNKNKKIHALFYP